MKRPNKNKLSSIYVSQIQRSTEPSYLRRLLIAFALIFLAFFLVLPLITVFYEAFKEGFGKYAFVLSSPDTLSALRITLIAAAVSVIANLIFGLAAAWSICKFDFRGKHLLITLIDLPFAVSPVVGGLMFVLLFGLSGWFGKWLMEYNIRIVFALPGVILATTFVTLPFIARELVPIMQAQGTDEEEAALVLGANGWQTFFRITLPNIRWGLLYGVILCNARAMGEFGAVSVVSGHLRGLTVTLPLHVEILYNEYKPVEAFAVASILSFVAVITLVVKTVLEWKERKSRISESGEGIFE